jgi:hypothetical protein
MAKQKIFKVSQKVGDTSSNQFFSADAATAVAGQLIAMATSGGLTVTVSVMDVETSSVNLDAFLKAGGILVGFGDIK